MALGIYELADSTTRFSQNGALTNALSLTFDGVAGGTLIRRYFVRNDDAVFFYTSISMVPVVKSGADIISGLNSFSWKLIAGDAQPLDSQWGLISPANTITLANIGSSGSPDISTYLPFWLRVTVPSGISVQVLEGTRLEITATENLV